MSDYGIGRAADIRPDERQGTAEKLLSFEGDAPTAGHLLIVGPNLGATDGGSPIALTATISVNDEIVSYDWTVYVNDPQGMTVNGA